MAFLSTESEISKQVIYLFYIYTYIGHKEQYVELPGWGAEPTAIVVKRLSLKHWTIREAQHFFLIEV